MKHRLLKYLPIIALVAGFVWAFIVAGVHSTLFALLPLLAFVFGYFSSWRRGMLNGFLLFLGYTLATALMWFDVTLNLFYPLQYFYAFFFGGFSLLLIGTMAPLVRRGFRKIGSIIAVVVTVFFMVWCGLQAWPAYNYYYQIIIQSSEDLEDLELYLPLPHASGDVYEDLLANPLEPPGNPLTKDYTFEIVATNYGPMLKCDINEMEWTKYPEYPYAANVIFWEPNKLGNGFLKRFFPWQTESAPHQLINLMPRYDIVTVDTVTSQQFRGPLKVREGKVVEEFKVPIMVKSAVDAGFEIRLENRTGNSGWVNFTYSKSNTHSELIVYEGNTSPNWQFVPVEVTERLRIRGIGD